MRGPNYSSGEIQFIEENWGVLSARSISKRLNRPLGGIINKTVRMELGAFLENGEYITANQFFKAIGRGDCWTYTLNQWANKGFPVKKKTVINCSFKIIYLSDFWKWAKKYRMHINFAKFKENVLGIEPPWVKEQRKADIEFAKYKISPWTPKEDECLKSLLKLYRYTYPQLSKAILRTEGAIKKRVLDLGIIERPLREDPHGVWTEEQIKTVISMYQKGYRSIVISEHIDKSEQAIKGKIERLIRDGMLVKWL